MAASKPFTFVLPDSHASISGGNLYNAALLAALLERQSATSTSWSEWSTEPAADGTFLIDSLNLVDFQALRRAGVANRHHVLLVHHLPSLEPGLPADDSARLVESKTLASFDGFVCTSKFTEAYLRSQGYQQPSLTIEPVFVPPAAIDRAKGQAACALMSCNLIARKGVLAFLRELAAETTDADEYRLDIVGRHDLEPAYGAACRDCVHNSARLGARVTLQGEIPFADMAKWYRESNLFLSAARMETFGISLQEARAYGLPILAVIGGNSENHVSAGITGELFEDPAMLAKGFLGLVRGRTTLASYLQQAQEWRPTDGGEWRDSADQLTKSMQSWFS